MVAVCVAVCAAVFAWLCVWLCGRLHVCVCVRLCAFVCFVRVRACVHVRVRASGHVCVCMRESAWPGCACLCGQCPHECASPCVPLARAPLRVVFFHNDEHALGDLHSLLPLAILNQRDAAGMTILHVACTKCSIAIIKEIASVKGVDVNARDDMGRTPLCVD
jgi:hypothetical protein